MYKDTGYRKCKYIYFLDTFYTEMLCLFFLSILFVILLLQF